MEEREQEIEDDLNILRAGGDQYGRYVQYLAAILDVMNQKLNEILAKDDPKP